MRGEEFGAPGRGGRGGFRGANLCVELLDEFPRLKDVTSELLLLAQERTKVVLLEHCPPLSSSACCVVLCCVVKEEEGGERKRRSFSCCDAKTTQQRAAAQDGRGRGEEGGDAHGGRGREGAEAHQGRKDPRALWFVWRKRERTRPQGRPQRPR